MSYQTFPGLLSPTVYCAVAPESFRDQPELFPFFVPALSIIQIIHSFLLSETFFLIASFNSKEVCFFMSRTISSNLFFLLPIIMWTWLGIMHHPYTSSPFFSWQNFHESKTIFIYSSLIKTSIQLTVANEIKYSLSLSWNLYFLLIYK